MLPPNPDSTTTSAPSTSSTTTTGPSPQPYPTGASTPGAAAGNPPATTNHTSEDGGSGSSSGPIQSGGGRPPKTTTNTSRRPSPPPGNPPPPSPTPTPPPETGILGRHDAVPPGISAQIDYFQGGGNDCQETPSVFTIMPVPRIDQSFMSTPDIYPVCIYEFDPDNPVLVVIKDPSERVVERRTLLPQELVVFNQFPFRRLAHDPTGVYTFTATQGGKLSTASLEVGAASSPQFIPLSNDAQGLPDWTFPMGRPGITFRMALGGFAPNSVVQIRIYGHPHTAPNGDSVVDYITSHAVRVDSVGAGVWELRTTSTDPVGCYQLFNELVTRDVLPLSFCLFNLA
jgi:hypothetical protein